MPCRVPSGRPRRCPVAVAAPVVALVAAAALAAGCATTVGPSGSGTSTTAATTYPSIAALDRALADRGITCTLEYQGLRDDVSEQEVSLCTIDGEQAYLRIWLSPERLAAFAASPEARTGTVAVGSNWTVTVASAPVASRIAAALGGSVPAADGPPGTS